MFKRLLLASAALVLLGAPGFAADLPMAPAYVPPPVYNWTGFYVGGNIGWGWGQNESTELAPGTTRFPTGTVFTTKNLSGFLGGAQLGFNYQTPYNLVVGVEADFDWTDLSGTATTISPTTPGFSSVSTSKLKDFALLTGRVGYAVANWLLYAKGGVALGQSSSAGVDTLANGTPFSTTTSSTDRSGWVIGAGVEWGFAPGWSAKIEYNHIDFGSTNLVINSVETVGLVSSSFDRSTERFDVVKGGINYRFNWGAPATY